MIRIVMDGMCSGCKYADLELDRICLSYSGTKEWAIRCLHRDACDNMETKTINRMTKMDEVEDKSECVVECDGYCEECPMGEKDAESEV